jgi:ABC-type Na+ transport system ATPase subunit NatA
MRSVADDLRDEQLREMLAMTPAERMRLAERLGEEALQFFMATNGLSREEAIARIKRQRRAGRTPSRCMDEP